MTEIIDTHGNRHDTKCISCDIQNGEIVLPVERIVETKNFAVEQDLEYPIEGFMIIRSKRHLLSIDEMSSEESEELIQLIRNVRAAMRKALGIQSVTFVQEESTFTSHFHIWLFPWHPWMLKRWRGKVNDVKEVMEFAKKEMSNEKNLNLVKEAVAKIKESLNRG